MRTKAQTKMVAKAISGSLLQVEEPQCSQVDSLAPLVQQLELPDVVWLVRYEEGHHLTINPLPQEPGPMLLCGDTGHAAGVAMQLATSEVGRRGEPVEVDVDQAISYAKSKALRGLWICNSAFVEVTRFYVE